MSRFSGVEDWIAVAFASALGFLTWWVAYSQGFGENVARAGAYTMGCLFFWQLHFDLRGVDCGSGSIC
jgi:hypothetical protein